ncbi:MAG: aldo/keto reductase [Bacteroidaceae bacterium]|nr:aldo/keto reductase [Bacteroidaceae bacterium]
MGKLVLGTVQFGLQYGVNSAGRPSQEAVKIILNAAAEGGITTLDTSSAYGNSEEVLGDSIATPKQFQIVSKYPNGEVPVSEMFNSSLKRLKINQLYGYLLHHFEVFKNNPKVWNEFIALKESGKVQKIGFSLYNPEELEFILKNESPFDLIQVPFNIFDKKFLPYMKDLHDKGVEIHVRSTFLQGLFFKDRKALPEKLEPMKKYLIQLDEFSDKSELSISEIALNYNLQNPYIDGVLIGVDNVEQLQMNLNSVKDTPIDIEIEVKEQELLNPSNWN